MNLIKIDSDYFYVEEISTQFSVGSHATINLTINTYKYPQYYNFFVDTFDNSLSFSIQFRNYNGQGCVIKTQSIDSMNYLLYVDIVCEYLEEITIQQKRDELIDEVLEDETSTTKNNINKNLIN